MKDADVQILFDSFKKRLSNGLPFSNKTSKDEDNLIGKIAIFFIILISLIWSLYTFNKTAPFQEGWYMVYSDMVLSGLRPYVDFEFVYFPVYLYLFTGIVAVFGSNLIVMRITGALLFVITNVIVMKVIDKFLPTWVAFISTLVGIFFSTVDEFYISYDYHQWVNLLFALFLLCFINSMEKKEKTNLIIAGVLCAIILLIRPHAGIILFFSVLSLYVVGWIFKINIFNKKTNRYFFIGVFSVILLFLIIMALMGLIGPFFGSAFNFEPKGNSLFAIIFSFVTNYIPPYYLVVILFVVASFFIVKRSSSETFVKSNRNIMAIVLCSILIITVLAVIIINPALLKGITVSYGSTRTILATFAILGVIVMASSLIAIVLNHTSTTFDVKTFGSFSIISTTSIAMVWGSTIGGPICALYIGTTITITIAYMLYFVLTYKDETKKIITASVITLISVALIMTCVSIKDSDPYHWWGNYEDSYQECDYSCDISYFDGIYMSESEKMAYTDFKNWVDVTIQDGDTMYCYANNQLFYHIAGIIPTTYSAICWFDVSTTSSIYKDLDYLKANNPKMIVFQDSGEDAINVHEYYYGSKPAHHELYSWLVWCRDNPESGYEVVSVYDGECPTFLMIKTA